MHYLVQRGKLRSQVINVPEGLPEILSDITREVLRCQPTSECLCEFIIDYLHSVIVTREKADMAKMIIDRALRTVDEIVADMCICDISKNKADHMCAAMEECFKRFLAQRRCEKNKNIEIIKFNEIDMLDELIQKCKFSEEELKISGPIIAAAYQKFVDAYMAAQENTQGTEALYQYFCEREMKRIEERKQQEAAIKIQANFRGYLVRRTGFLSREVDKPLEKKTKSWEELLKQEAAARKIQRFFRQHTSFLHKKTESRAPLSAQASGHDTLEQPHNANQADDNNLTVEHTIEQYGELHEDQMQERLVDHQTSGKEDHQGNNIYIEHEKKVVVDIEVDHTYNDTIATIERSDDRV